MSESEENQEKQFCVDVAKQSRATCKKCKEKCLTGQVRIAKLAPSPFGAGNMKNWHHPQCIFEQILKQRVTTKRIEKPDDLDGWNELDDDNKEKIFKLIDESNKNVANKYNLKYEPLKKLDGNVEKINKKEISNSINNNRDMSFREFRRLIADITNVNSYNDKTNLVKEFLKKGSDKNGFKGDIKLWVRLLLPGVIKRVYNLQSKQLIKLFARILNSSQEEMLEHLEQGDISVTISHFYTINKAPPKKSCLNLSEIDQFLNDLSKLTKEEDQMGHFEGILPKCTENDLKTLIRLIKGDLRMNAGAKHILDGVHNDAYEMYKASKDIDSVLNRCLEGESSKANLKATISLLTPVQPMLAEACKSIEQAFKKCPNGMYSEIKYDGERVQIHKRGNEFKYFSRALKPVVPHKVVHLKNYISKAFPKGEDLILDSEILMVEHETGKPLPFGTLGIHKKTEFKDANVCLFVFDCIYYNGEDLMSKPLKFRKNVLRDNMKEIKNHVVFSEMEEIYKVDDLKAMISKTLSLGLEGLVLKDLKSIYEPGKRHWLKVKKDYLFDGAMADSADLIVLGAWYGTGKKGGMMSIFLMGCYDPNRDYFCTVTKVHTGHDDKTLERLQNELDMIKISGDINKIPKWLRCTKTMIPDLVAKDPKNQPVWEITGAEFTQHEVHTANGISIRFPRVTKIREEKTWKEATNLNELEKLMEESKTKTDYSLLMNSSTSSITSVNTSPCSSSSSSKEKNSPKKRKLENIDNNNKKKINTVSLDSNLFENVKLLCVPEAFKFRIEIIERFKKNGGVILDEDNWKQATHVLHHYDHDINDPENMLYPKTAKHVISEWLEDSLYENKLVDVREYYVRWKSTIHRNDDSDQEFHLK
nr:DNA ligase 3 isoform X1 [Onthophagus taurus]